MQINEKVKKVRELSNLTQEEMASQLNMSTNGYAKIEQGKTRLNIPMLERITAVLGINLMELLNINDKNLVCLISENSQNSSNYYANETAIELEKLQLILNHKDELLLQKDREIEALKLALSAFRNT
ncbi:helix-turn-helix domain-containing protein [Neisseria cinerea]|uniref:helix-turn-helix domain-containing protein n=1 Tax=Neisseria cinerea TaxID=483 RepID=UPI000D31004C|nr:helix-turn-helix transcriptional regulator [Neisseria cinerea]